VSLKLSPQMKIVALLGLLVALALGAGSMMLGRSQPGSVAATPTVPLKHFHPPAQATAASRPAAKHAATKPAAAKAVAKPAAKAASRAVAKPKAAAKPTPKPKHAPAKPKPAVAENGLPTALDELLHGHRVVVVAVWDPEAPADRIAFLEAQAGARDANAGFLAVSVLNERIAGPLTALAGNGTVLPDPGILVYKQPATLMNRLDGFSDRAAVAAAVANALMATAPPAGATGTTAATTPTTPGTVPSLGAPAATTP